MHHNKNETSAYSLSSTSGSSEDKWTSSRRQMTDRDKAKFIKRCRAEAKADEATNERASSRCFKQWKSDVESQTVCSHSSKVYAWIKSFFGNLPLTIGALAMAFANLGVEWFKFAEEHVNSCQPVHFHSSQCSFPEFPGCYYCDTSARAYKTALLFHWTCSAIAGILACTIFVKLLVARQVVFHELSSPTTAAPAGLICMAVVVVFAGRGFIGMCMVSLASAVHLCLVIWFVYMAFAYRILPDPSWFPNTVGIGISAVKLWLYFPTAGHFLMSVGAVVLRCIPVGGICIFLTCLYHSCYRYHSS
jgi:hypothetical protein